MSNNRDLLTEAIADAKAVKETAIANAKAALEEAFTPHLKSMLAAKLEEMDKQDDLDENARTDAEEEGYKDGMKDEKEDLEEIFSEVDEAKKDEKEEVKEVSLEELLAELNEDDLTEASRVKGEKGVGNEDGDRDDSKTEKETEKMRFKESEDLDEAKKEEVEESKSDELSENARTDAEEEGYKDGLKDEKKDLEEDARTDAEEEGYLDGEKDEKEDIEDDEDIDLEDMSEDDLKGFIEDVIKDMVSSGELEAGEEFETEEDGDVEIDGEEEIEVEDEIEIPMMEKKEELEEMDEVSWNDKNNPTRGASKVDLDPKKVGTSTAAYSINEEEVTKALAEIKDLKKELTEVNLLNAKLLYTNKIFKSKNLNEAKKVKVLKAFDKASTVKEAKVIFETLNEGMSSRMTKSPVNEVKGSASKASGIAPQAKQPILENAAFTRMQQLAGIIKREN
mgnify:FL=1|tara:strand:+ start:740 stop:2089 length:1350 start_codon:yes stop_codon:yes gene_type:complete